MTISPTEFAEALYQEHLEEISFLYEQRLLLLDDPEVEWPRIGDFERRMEAHLDALLVGGEHAMEVCLKATDGGDFGELYGALRVLCRSKRLDLVKSTIAALTAEDRDQLLAAGDALKADAPAEWVGELVDFVKEEPATRAAVVARFLGFRRLPPPDGFWDLLAADSEIPSAELIWAAGRIRPESVRPLLQPFLSHSDSTVSSEAALAMLKMGEADTLNLCSSHDDATWPLVPMGIGGSPQHLPQIMRHAETPDALLAMGLLGDTSAIETLLSKLEDDELKASAAAALQMITGADLYETVFVPEPVDEDELTPEELQKLKSGELTEPPGARRGENVTRLSEQPGPWKEWWSERQGSFQEDIRYRNGAACSPSILVEILASPKNPRLIRQLAYEELVVRYDADFPFETDMPVPDQLEAIGALQRWATDVEVKVEDGKWHFAGRAMA